MTEGGDKNGQLASASTRNILRDVFNDGEHHLKTKFTIHSLSPADLSNNLIKSKSDVHFESLADHPQQAAPEFVLVGDGRAGHPPTHQSAPTTNTVRSSLSTSVHMTDCRKQTVVAKQRTLLEELLKKRYGSFYRELVAFQQGASAESERFDLIGALNRTRGAGESRIPIPVISAPASRSHSKESIQSNHINLPIKRKSSQESMSVNSSEVASFGTNPSRNRMRKCTVKAILKKRTRRPNSTIESRRSGRATSSLNSTSISRKKLTHQSPRLHPKPLQGSVRTKRSSSALIRRRSPISNGSFKHKRRKRSVISTSPIVKRSGTSESSDTKRTVLKPRKHRTSRESSKHL